MGTSVYGKRPVRCEGGAVRSSRLMTPPSLMRQMRNPVGRVDAVADELHRPSPITALNPPGCELPNRTDQNVRLRRVRWLLSASGTAFAEPHVVLVPAGVVPRLVVAAGGTQHGRVALLVAREDRVRQPVETSVIVRRSRRRWPACSCSGCSTAAPASPACPGRHVSCAPLPA